eukprot:1679093-Amphidinium_carterae.2
MGPKWDLYLVASRQRENALNHCTPRMLDHPLTNMNGTGEDYLPRSTVFSAQVTRAGVQLQHRCSYCIVKPLLAKLTDLATHRQPFSQHASSCALISPTAVSMPKHATLTICAGPQGSKPSQRSYCQERARTHESRSSA